MNLGYCPTCKAEFDIAKRKDGTYTIDCVLCDESFSFRVVNGKYKKWHPPKIADIQIRGKGGGEPEKTYGDKQSDIPVIR